MSSAPERAWRVELTRGAADDYRSRGPVLRRSLEELFETLAQGVPGGASRETTDPPSYRVATRDGQVVRVVFRARDRVALVVGIEGADRAEPSARRSRAVAFGTALGDLVEETRYAARSLRRAPAFTLGVVLTLAVGLGGATTIFGLVDTVFRAPLPFEDGDRVVRIRSSSMNAAGDPFAFNVTPRDFALVRDGNRVFEGVVAQSGRSIALLGDGPPERASAIGVSAGWEELLGVRPHVGRTFTPEEQERGGAAGVALISHALWQSRFGGSPDAVGRELRYDGGSLVVVGVLEPRFAYPYDAQIWTPWRADPTDWTSSGLNVVARLSPGVTPAEADADADRLYEALKAESPGVAPNQGFLVEPARDDFIREQAQALQSLALAVLFLLLLVCANVANLFTARMAARRREAALRVALGAGRARLFRSAVVEALLVFVFGGTVGLALVVLLGDVVSVLIPDVMRTQLDLGTIGIGPSMLLFTVVLSLVAGAATGSVAALRGSRVQPDRVLRDGARGNAGSSARLRDALVVAELALALVLLVGASVLAEHFGRLRATDLGFETEDVFTVQVALEQERFGSGEARVGFVEAAQERLVALPGVEAVGMISVNPLCCGDWGARIRVEGQERPADAPPITIFHRYVTPEYFEAMRLPLVRGRAFTTADRTDGAPVVIVDEAFAARFWPGQDPLGRRVSQDAEGAPLRTVVGVAADAYAEGDYTEGWYVPFHQEPLGRSNEIVHFMVRSATGQAPSVAELRAAIAEVDPVAAVFAPARMAELRAEAIAADRMGATITSVFAVAGLLLAGIGLYGLLAYQVELRRRELGTRIALGAHGLDVGSVVLGHTARLLLLGVLAGSALAYAVNHALRSVVEGVTLAGPGLFAVVVAVLTVTALVSTAVPLRRALASDPGRILQGE